jgi:outer membrane murein-binding lipoprotein Lpp
MRLVRGAAAVLGVVLLAGCSDGGTANETLPSTSSTSAAETSASLPPLGPPDMPMPDEAREQTAAGADAFIRYYMDVYTAAQATMDPTYMDAFSQGCETCDTLISNLSDDMEAGYKYEGGRVAVQSSSFGNLAQSRIEGAFSIAQEALTVRDGAGNELPDLSAPAASLNCGAILTWSPIDRTWVLTQWDVN